MIKNYFVTALRNILRYKTFSLINILGLAVGMTCTILIMLWVIDEMSFDKIFRNSDKIYLVTRGDKNGLTSMTSKYLAPTLKQDLSTISISTCYEQVPLSFKVLIQKDLKGFEENYGLADSNFFKVFSFRFYQGNSANALSDPNSMVITKQIAEKYFGNNDALDKILTVSLFGKQRSMKVCGVIDNIPSNSHIKCNIFFNADFYQTFGSKENGWKDQSFETYVMLKNKSIDKSNIAEISSQIKQCELQHQKVDDGSLNYSLLALEDIHLHGSNIKFLNETGDIKNVRIFSAVALFILFIACINYINISTALSLKRIKEIGIKKSLGVEKKTLIFQFMGEGLLHSLVAIVISIVLTQLSLTGFNQLAGKSISISFLNPYFICGAAILAIITGILSSLYPAIFVSSFHPIQILAGKIKMTNRLLSRKGLVILQFCLSIMLMTSTIVVYNQLEFMHNGKLGLDKEKLICVSMIGDANVKYDILRNELLANSGIIDVTRSEEVNSNNLSATGAVFKNENGKNEEIHCWVLYSDCSFVSTYRIGMKEGRFYSDKHPTDRTSAFVINETAAKIMGMKSPLQEYVYLRGRLGRIIGVTKDFHFASFHNTIEPLIFMIPDSSQQAGRYRTISIRYADNNPEKIIAATEKLWKQELPGTPFNYHFYDDSLNSLYKSETHMASVFTYFSILSILITSLGLYGLVSISIERRVKEIGIRKVLGASMSNIVFILSKEYAVWVMLSNIVTWPVAYYFMNKWLQNFAYRTELSLWIFVSSGGIALVISLTTVSIQAIKAAVANPIKALRYE
jgi:putative ABC transport system permease protein